MPGSHCKADWILRGSVNGAPGAVQRNSNRVPRMHIRARPALNSRKSHSTGPGSTPTKPPGAQSAGSFHLSRVHVGHCSAGHRMRGSHALLVAALEGTSSTSHPPKEGLDIVADLMTLRSKRPIVRIIEISRRQFATGGEGCEDELVSGEQDSRG